MMVAGGALGKARLALSNGRADEAERILRKQLERREDANTRLLLAQALLQQQQINDAIAQIRRVLREQPKNVDALLLLSASLVQRGGLSVPKEAEESARRAVQLQPKAARAHVQLAEVLAASRDSRGARLEIDEAIRLEPRLAGAHLMRAVILLGDKDPVGAVQSADSALRYDRNLTQAEFIKANALVEVKRYEEALVALDTATKTNPMLVGTNAYTLRGRIYFRQRKIAPSYAQFLVAQQMSGRLVRFAPVLAALNMVLSVFGTRAPFVLAFLIALIVTAVFVGVSFIPVAGPWIVAVLFVALVGVFAYGALRQARGGVLPAVASERPIALAMLVGGLVIGAGVMFAIEFGVGNGLFHAVSWVTPLTIAIAGAAGVLGAAAAVAFGPRLLGRGGTA